MSTLQNRNQSISLWNESFTWNPQGCVKLSSTCLFPCKMLPGKYDIKTNWQVGTILSILQMNPTLFEVIFLRIGKILNILVCSVLKMAYVGFFFQRETAVSPRFMNEDVQRPQVLTSIRGDASSCPVRWGLGGCTVILLYLSKKSYHKCGWILFRPPYRRGDICNDSSGDKSLYLHIGN